MATQGAKKAGRTREAVLKDMDAVCAELAGIELYLEGSVQRHGAAYRKKDGTVVRHKATPSLQYPMGDGRQGRMRVPWEHVGFVEGLLREGKRRKQLLARHRDLARELVAEAMRSGDAAQKKTPRSRSPRTSPPASEG